MDPKPKEQPPDHALRTGYFLEESRRQGRRHVWFWLAAVLVALGAAGAFLFLVR